MSTKLEWCGAGLEMCALIHMCYMCVYMHTLCIYTHTLYIYIYMHTYIHTYIHTYTYTRIHMQNCCIYSNFKKGSTLSVNKAGVVWSWVGDVCRIATEVGGICIHVYMYTCIHVMYTFTHLYIHFSCNVYIHVWGWRCV